MPTQQVESTLADLGISLIADRLPSLMDHYLGFEMITANDEKTRAAGLLGFQVGQELLYVPILFLNGKVKGTEVLYLKNSDVFTAASKQWVEYLTTRNPGVMGAGATPATPLQQPNAQNLAIFNRVPQGGKLAGLPVPAPGASPAPLVPPPSLAPLMQPQMQATHMPAPTHMGTPVPVPLTPIPVGPMMAKGAELTLDKKFEQGAADEFFSKVASLPVELVDLPIAPSYNLPSVLRGLGKQAYLRFMNQVVESPALFEKVSEFYGDELLISDWPEEKTGNLHGSHAISPEVGAISSVIPGVGPLIHGVSSGDNMQGVREGARSLGEEILGGAVGAGAGGLLGGLTGNPTMANLGMTAGGFVGARIGGAHGAWASANNYNKSRQDAGEVAQQAKVAFVTAHDLLEDNQKTAGLELTVEQKEECMRHGFVVLDKRAAEEKSLTYEDDYRTRFDAPKTTGFYEIINQAGSIEKVFIAKQPFLVEEPTAHFPNCIIVDPGTGIFVLPGPDDQVFTRSNFTVAEAVWKDKMTGMTGIKSVRPGNSYMLVSPELLVSAPFRVRNKSTEGGDTNIVAETVSSVRYRANCDVGYDGTLIRVVDQDQMSKPKRVGSITYVPSSWKVIELDQRRISGELSDEEYRARRDREDKARRAITPGGYSTLMAAILSKGIFKLNLHKSGSYVTATVQGHPTEAPMTKAAAVRFFVEDLGLDVADGIKLFEDTQKIGKLDRWIEVKQAFNIGGVEISPEVGGALGGAAIGGLGGALSSDKHRGRNALIGAGLGAAAGGLGGHLVAGSGALAVPMAAAPESPTHAPPVDSELAGLPGPLGSNDVVVPPVGTHAPALDPSLQGLPDNPAPNDTLPPGTGITTMPDGTKIDAQGNKVAAHGLNTPDAIYGGQAFPDPQTDLGQNPSGFAEQQPTSQIEPINMQSMEDPSQDWRDNDQANWDKIKQPDMDFLMRAANSGSQPVFDSAMVGMLLRTNRSSAKVDEWLPDLVSALDSKCRLLLLFYWHNQDMAEDYGKNEMAELEDVLLSSIKTDGQLVLFLKQKSGESPHAKIDAFSEGTS